MRLAFLGASVITGVVMTAEVTVADNAALRSDPIWKKLEVHVSEMVSDGFERPSAEHLAFAGYVHKIGELCGPIFLAKSDVEWIYHDALKESRLPTRIIEKHQPIFESIVENELRDEQTLVRFCQK